MIYKLEISKKAKKFIKNLPKHEAVKILKIIHDLTTEPRPRWVEKIKGIIKKNYYRICWGDYRILYSIDDQILLVSVIKVDGRDDSYKKLNRLP